MRNCETEQEEKVPTVVHLSFHLQAQRRGMKAADWLEVYIGAHL